MVTIGKDIRTRIQFFCPTTKESKTLTVYGLDFTKIYENTQYFLEQLVTYPEIKLICYGGTEDGEKTIRRKGKRDNSEKSSETQEEPRYIETS